MACIFVAIHAEGLNLLDGLDIVVGRLGAIGNGGDLVDLRTDGLEVFSRRNGTVGGTICLWGVGRHDDVGFVRRKVDGVVLLTLSQSSMPLLGIF